MLHTFYKVYIDEVEVAVFNSDAKNYLVNFLDCVVKNRFFDIQIQPGYYNDCGEWITLENLD